jgi:secreted PhoX family phosphatase
MACFQGRRDSNILIRNHELGPAENKFGSRIGCLSPNGKVYDPFILSPGQGGGGTTTLIIDRHGRLVKHHISLGGTIRNCAGGPTPWDSWISCEEDVSTPATSNSVTKKHGYNFEVPADLREAVDPIPLVDMGRFNHEANATDPRTGCVYQTEDRGDSCFYKFEPKVRRVKKFGDLQKGGRLHAMAIEPGVLAACDNTILPMSGTGVDTRTGVRSFLGQPLPVSWVRIDEVDPEGDTVRAEAQLKGAAIFSRGEGAWYADGLIYFICTGGGDLGNGQVWAYNPRRETVTLLVESTSEGALDNPDNITVAPDGTLYLCEDGGGQQFVVGVDDAGDVFKFAHNNFTTSEFCGACFSDDGKFMFVNIQNPGITFVIFRDDRRPIMLDRGHRRHR